MTQKLIDQILKATVYDLAVETPLDKAPLLSQRLQNSIFLKREDLQEVFSFKLRGAYNKMSHLTTAQKKAGIVASSAGNHAQGVALAAQKLGIHAHIIMPKTTPTIKVNAVKAKGAKITLTGDTYDEAYAFAQALSKEQKKPFIHPYDDEHVIAGQGTIGVELIRQHSEPIFAIFIPVGGGGLISGVASYIKHINPNIKIIGVEPEDAPCMHDALKAGKRITLPHVGIFADGVAVKQVGKLPFRIAQKVVDEVVLVSIDEICAAVKDIFED
ncbi:MAG: pyridoxal-phosphate dependent enzyme, partial [Candidatus Margulisbacteria bacterium]|nr:pyridoxal-phosphate dependent enzyme [Candidatus Margulisiibacteriota bacterium]